MRRLLSLALVASLLAGMTALPAFGQTAPPADTWTQVDVEQTSLQSASFPRHYAGPIQTPAGSVSAAALTAPVTVFSNGFDTAPSPWLMDGWGVTTYRKSAGTYSAYCAGGLVPAPGPYPNDTITWMDAGPFDLSSFATAQLEYDLWAVLEGYCDYLYIGVSTDNENWDLSGYSGSTAAWKAKLLDLSAYCGQPQVWITFGFESDMDVQKEGVYIDRVVLTARRFTNAAPLARDDTYYLHPNQVKTVDLGVLRNDWDDNNDPIQAHKLTDPLHGTLTLETNGVFTYTPEADFTGYDSFTYQVSDPYVAGPVPGKVNIYIGNNPPVAVNDYVETTDGAGVNFVFTRNDIDLEGDRFTAEKLSDPVYGSLFFDASGIMVYWPYYPDVETTDSFTYRIFDGIAYSGIATVTIVNGPSKAPVFRFYNASAGTHFYTSSAEERDIVMSRWPNIFAYEGIAYYINTVRNTQPLYRFYNKKNGSHFYTASANEANAILAKWPTIFTLDGQTYKVSPSQVLDSVMVLRLYNKQNGSHFYTASIEECNIILSKWWDTYSLDGPAFWLAQ